MGVGIESYGHRWLYKGEIIEVGGKSIDYVEDGARRQRRLWGWKQKNFY